MRRVAALLAATVWLGGAAPAPAAAAEPVDLPAVVLSRIEGYQPAPAGIRPAGALTDDELAQFAPDPARRQLLRASNTRSFARSFVTTGPRRAAVIGLDLHTVQRARSFLGGARESALDAGEVFPVAGIAHGFRVSVRPARTPGASVQQVFLQSGQLAFIVVVSDVAASPVRDPHVTRPARAQAAAVPKRIAAQEDASTLTDIAREAGYALAFLVPIAAAVGAVVVLRRRRGTAAAA